MTALARPAFGDAARGWLLAALYPLVAALVALFIAYPLVELLVRAVYVDGAVTLRPIGALLANPNTRQVVWNTLALGGAVAVLGTLLATLYAYAMTRIAVPWKPLWHFIALLPTISPPVVMALSLILLYGRRGIVTHELAGLDTTALYGWRGLIAAQLLS
ncbi:MAG: hypothetical protein IT518_03625, partial [Burkholderiales bacterium]|nr:hypothetical protein [Burkholderiales bacterium]